MNKNQITAFMVTSLWYNVAFAPTDWANSHNNNCSYVQKEMVEMACKFGSLSTSEQARLDKLMQVYELMKCPESLFPHISKSREK